MNASNVEAFNNGKASFTSKIYKLICNYLSYHQYLNHSFSKKNLLQNYYNTIKNETYQK